MNFEDFKSAFDPHIVYPTTEAFKVGLHNKTQRVIVGLFLIIVLSVAAGGCIGGNDKKSSKEVLYSGDISLSPDEMKNLTFTITAPGVLTVKYDFKAPDDGPTILTLTIKQNGHYLNAKVISAQKGEHINGVLSANVTEGTVEVGLLNGANAVLTPITYHITVEYSKKG